jgi:hypothetical protein
MYWYKAGNVACDLQTMFAGKKIVRKKKKKGCGRFVQCIDWGG